MFHASAPDESKPGVHPLDLGLALFEVAPLFHDYDVVAGELNMITPPSVDRQLDSVS